jgi:Tfp pilus assembly protein PilF
MPQPVAGSILLVALTLAGCGSSRPAATSAPAASAPQATDAQAAELYVRRATKLCETHRLRECVQELDEAIRLAGADARLFTMRGGAKFRLNDHAGAASDFTRSIAKDPKNARVFLLRALSRSLLDPPDKAGACEDLEAARKLGLDVHRGGAGAIDWCRQ